MITPGRVGELEPGEVYVTIHVDEKNPLFPAKIDDRRWNGWVIPRFRPEVADQVVRWVIETNAAGPFPEDQDFVYGAGDVFVHVLAGSTDPIDVDIVEADHEGRYPVGALSWTWQLAQEDL